MRIREDWRMRWAVLIYIFISPCFAEMEGLSNSVIFPNGDENSCLSLIDTIPQLNIDLSPVVNEIVAVGDGSTLNTSAIIETDVQTLLSDILLTNGRDIIHPDYGGYFFLASAGALSPNKIYLMGSRRWDRYAQIFFKRNASEIGMLTVSPLWDSSPNDAGDVRVSTLIWVDVAKKTPIEIWSAISLSESVAGEYAKVPVSQRGMLREVQGVYRFDKIPGANGSLRIAGGNFSPVSATGLRCQTILGERATSIVFSNNSGLEIRIFPRREYQFFLNASQVPTINGTAFFNNFGSDQVDLVRLPHLGISYYEIGKGPTSASYFFQRGNGAAMTATSPTSTDAPAKITHFDEGQAMVVSIPSWSKNAYVTEGQIILSKSRDLAGGLSLWGVGIPARYPFYTDRSFHFGDSQGNQSKAAIITPPNPPPVPVVTFQPFPAAGTTETCAPFLSKKESNSTADSYINYLVTKGKKITDNKTIGQGFDLEGLYSDGQSLFYLKKSYETRYRMMGPNGADLHNDIDLLEMPFQPNDESTEVTKGMVVLGDSSGKRGLIRVLTPDAFTGGSTGINSGALTPNNIGQVLWVDPSTSKASAYWVRINPYRLFGEYGTAHQSSRSKTADRKIEGVFRLDSIARAGSWPTFKVIGGPFSQEVVRPVSTKCSTDTSDPLQRSTFAIALESPDGRLQARVYLPAESYDFGYANNPWAYREGAIYWNTGTFDWVKLPFLSARYYNHNIVERGDGRTMHFFPRGGSGTGEITSVSPNGKFNIDVQFQSKQKAVAYDDRIEFTSPYDKNWRVVWIKGIDGDLFLPYLNDGNGLEDKWSYAVDSDYRVPLVQHKFGKVDPVKISDEGHWLEGSYIKNFHGPALLSFVGKSTPLIAETRGPKQIYRIGLWAVGNPVFEGDRISRIDWTWANGASEAWTLRNSSSFDGGGCPNLSADVTGIRLNNPPGCYYLVNVGAGTCESGNWTTLDGTHVVAPWQSTPNAAGLKNICEGMAKDFVDRERRFYKWKIRAQRGGQSILYLGGNLAKVLEKTKPNDYRSFENLPVNGDAQLNGCYLYPTQHRFFVGALLGRTVSRGFYYNTLGQDINDGIYRPKTSNGGDGALNRGNGWIRTCGTPIQ